MFSETDRFSGRVGDDGLGWLAPVRPCSTYRDGTASRKIITAHERPPGRPPTVCRESGEFARSRTDIGAEAEYDSPATLTVSRPNKLRAHRKGDIVNQEFFYDGKTLTLYNPRENLYATTAAPPTIDEMLDFAREKLDIIAPGAEILYKNAAERMLKVTTSGFVVGPSVVGGVKSTHLAFRGAEVDWQIWIEEGDKLLPRKFILTSKQVKGEPQFTLLVRAWDLAPKLTDKEFTFVPPKGAKKIDFLNLTAGAAKPK